MASIGPRFEILWHVNGYRWRLLDAAGRALAAGTNTHRHHVEAISEIQTLQQFASSYPITDEGEPPPCPNDCPPT